MSGLYKSIFLRGVAISFCLFISSSATIINIPDDYNTIQEGIDASADGDTVLVQPATYVENINFNGHNIVLASLFLTTEDVSFISTTIIDGYGMGSVVIFENGEDSTTAICGFTIRNGRSRYGGGIFCESSNPLISDNIICGNFAVWRTFSSAGGGIYCTNSEATITNNLIMENEAGYIIDWDNIPGPGGGLYCANSNAVIRNNIIIGNRGLGGIHCSGSPTILNTIIRYNYGSEIEGYPSIRYCNVEGGWPGEGNIDEDPLFVDPLNGNRNICAQSPCIDAGDPNINDPDSSRSDIGVFFAEHPECFLGRYWYVSVDGNDTTGDGSQGSPFRTIQHGINTSLHGDHVIVENGLYYENIVVYMKNIKVMSEYVFSDDPQDIENTILDGSSGSSAVSLKFTDYSTIVIGFTISNGGSHYGGGIYCFNSEACIETNIIADNYAYEGGGVACIESDPIIINNIILNNSSGFAGGIYCGFGSNPLISRNTICDNSGTFGGGIECMDNSNPVISGNMFGGNIANDGAGIYCNESNPLIANNVMIENSAHVGEGGAICCRYSNPFIMNNTISRNVARYGGGIYSYNSSPYVINTIFWADSASIEGAEIYIESGSPNFAYCDIEGGWEGDGNIDVDPLFKDPESGDFHLMATECGDQYVSRCIDSGDSAVIDSLLDCSWGLGTILSDMGAYGGGDSLQVGIENPEVVVPGKMSLDQNYPNPFNALTIIQYNLPQAAEVTVEIYDILGRRVQTIIKGNQAAGNHEISWDAGGHPSGVYFYRIQAGDIIESRKMVLIK